MFYELYDQVFAFWKRRFGHSQGQCFLLGGFNLTCRARGADQQQLLLLACGSLDLFFIACQNAERLCVVVDHRAVFQA
ncbi:hypothetical protein D3C87_2105530 [compost metagenome]